MSWRAATSRACLSCATAERAGIDRWVCDTFWSTASDKWALRMSKAMTSVTASCGGASALATLTPAWRATRGERPWPWLRSCGGGACSSGLAFARPRAILLFCRSKGKQLHLATRLVWFPSARCLALPGARSAACVAGWGSRRRRRCARIAVASTAWAFQTFAATVPGLDCLRSLVFARSVPLGC